MNRRGYRIPDGLGKAAVKTHALQTLTRGPLTRREREAFGVRPIYRRFRPDGQQFRPQSMFRTIEASMKMKYAQIHPARSPIHCLILLVASCLTAFLTARADERLFTYVQEAEVLPKGGLEFEQWLTHRRSKANGVFARWDFREELEYGLTDRLTVAGYLNFKNTHSEGVTGRTDESSFEFEGISTELKYQLLNPNLKPIGVLLYGEATYNGDEFELEQKLVLQKNFGEKWVAAFNVTLEQEWVFTPTGTEEELALELTAGIAYKLNSHWSVGVEGRNHRVFAPGLDFSHRLADAWFLGPNVHYARGKWWATLTVLPQVHGSPNTRNGLELEEHEKIEVRLIAGINF